MYKNSWLGAFCQLQSDHPRLKFEFLLQKIRLWSRVPCFQGQVSLLTKSDTGAIVNLSIYLKMCCKVSRLTSPTIRSILFPLQSTLTEKILRTFSCIKNLKPPNFSLAHLPYAFKYFVDLEQSTFDVGCLKTDCCFVAKLNPKTKRQLSMKIIDVSVV